jgi:hypothetical protein
MKLCPQCDRLTATLIRENSTAKYFCWRCFASENYEPNDIPPPLSVREGMFCLRVVENRDTFALLYVYADSNVQAMALAAIEWGAVNMEARPAR